MFEETRSLARWWSQLVGEPLTGNLTELKLDPNFNPAHGAGAGVQGEVIGASEDGSYVYFVANGLLGDAAEHGASGGNCETSQGDVQPVYGSLRRQWLGSTPVHRDALHQRWHGRLE